MSLFFTFWFPFKLSDLIVSNFYILSVIDLIFICFFLYLWFPTSFVTSTSSLTLVYSDCHSLIISHWIFSHFFCISICFFSSLCLHVSFSYFIHLSIFTMMTTRFILFFILFLHLFDSPVFAADRSKFKTCEESGFCR